jgi:hypothetical protein
VRLAQNVAAGRVLEQPAIVAERYGSVAHTSRR